MSRLNRWDREQIERARLIEAAMREAGVQPEPPPADPAELLTPAGGWRPAFSRIYDRDAQIREVMESIRTAKETGMQVRNHVLLYGPPGCGKSEIMGAVATALGDRAVRRLDATAMTGAGAQEILLGAAVPAIIAIEEAEKLPQADLRWLLSVMDGRAEVRKTTVRTGAVARECRCLVMATVNDVEKFRGFLAGALYSRFSVPVYCPAPDRALLRRILTRELERIPGGRPEWIDPAIDYAVSVEGTYQVRRIVAIMTNARDRLLDGSFQASREQMRKEEEGEAERLRNLLP